MLEVLGDAQGSGQKTQQDALLGQGSIFDLGDAEPAGGAPVSPFGGAHHRPVPAIPDERTDRGAMEKETLGLFLSSHPLKEVRAALRLRVECSLAELEKKKDGEWVTVGGTITESKRIRTKKGEPMMFATLDDLEGSVEMLVFNSAYASNADKIGDDKVLIVRGRVDHKEQGETKLVVQDVEVFEPTHEEVEDAKRDAAALAAAPPKRLTVDVSGKLPAHFIDDFKELVHHHRGDYEVMLRVGEHALLLGPDYKVSDTASFRSELKDLTGVRIAA
jgi:DNA polymerase-3 subunit alpha